MVCRSRNLQKKFPQWSYYSFPRTLISYVLNCYFYIPQIYFYSREREMILKRLYILPEIPESCEVGFQNCTLIFLQRQVITVINRITHVHRKVVTEYLFLFVLLCLSGQTNASKTRGLSYLVIGTSKSNKS